jgi:pimeloyl-ACP methyl ester carboxylesterase
VVDAVEEHRMSISRRTSWATWTIPTTPKTDTVLRQVADPILEAPEPLPTPSLFAREPNWVQPLQSPASNLRGDSGADAFLVPAELDADSIGQQPLQVDLAPAAGALGDAFAVFPIAYDDEFFYFAGPPKRLGQETAQTRLSNKLAMTVTRLPDLSQEPSAPEGSSRTRLGVLRAVRLGFFKLVGIPAADTGLRKPRLDNGKVAYDAVAPGSVSQGRIALLVHGFLSDTSWMVQGLLDDVRAAGYDHVLTWDYETITSPIRGTLEELVSSLANAGVQPGSGRLDVIAHSMGCLVTRSLIAQAPAVGMVRRAILMGPPNAGTVIANVPDVITNVASAFINVSYGPVSLRSVVRFLWHAVDKGLADLQPHSSFLTWVNQDARRQSVPLTLVAGNNSGGAMGTLFQRMLHGGADLFYGGPNDLVVPVASMRSVAAPPFPSVAYEEVPSNHFDYLIPNTPSHALVGRWLATP